MRIPTAITRARLRVALLATVALAYAGIPTLGALHHAQHFAYQTAAEACTTPQLAATVDPSAEGLADCEICQLATRSKHVAQADHRPTAYLHDHGRLDADVRLEPVPRRAIARPAARAPPLA